MHLHVVTLFPELVEAVVRVGIPARAVDKGLISLRTWNPRDYTHDRHRTVDDRPYGGGPGMVMKAEPLTAAVRAARKAASRSGERRAHAVYLSPQGRPLDQRGVEELATHPELILVAGRYEGVDERFIESEIDSEWSLGDYVLSGGELGAMVIIDAITRLLPGALGHEASAAEDSFANGLLDCPHYTRPEVWDERGVPAVLLGGNHERIRQWRLRQSLERTWQRRPELMEGREMSPEEHEIFDDLRRASADGNAD
ncbi:MAG: tRNA (guanosine(37)-N1)-methyltransferase TrmD [Gammaproteobacteria bacterium]